RLLPWWSRWEAAAAAMVRVAVYDCRLPRRWLPAADDEGGGFGRAVVVSSGVVMVDLSRVVGLRWWWLQLHGVEGGRSGYGEQFWGSPEISPEKPPAAAAGREWWPASGGERDNN
nr:hypothetical protein [Tanacetum cinerariifolium]